MGKLCWTNMILCGPLKILSNSHNKNSWDVSDFGWRRAGVHPAIIFHQAKLRHYWVGGKTFRSQILCIVFCWCDFFWSCVMMTCLPIKKTGSQPIESKPPKIDFCESVCREVCWFRLHTSGDLTHQFRRLIIWVVSLHRFFVASWSFTLQGTRKTRDPPNGFQPENHRLKMVIWTRSEEG